MAFKCYLDGELESHLRVFVFWLEQGKAPGDGEPLPIL